ncbi:YlmH family RNA-binding protein [Paraclostridium sordellii]|uniref:RNA-binding cell division protein n=1 Tax=Paraclostridium sordellii TaxID=1505 RepID=A0A0C7QLJ3_PARSO|nr:YlmH/Sll1252 family protein [Paeniclostridium sordellii]QYE97538.1 RNA-binding protein [Paeniclostridium sordellii]CEN79822.1 RNA-binding cell division protein [[Clostridium] sordellii] [Paeniclostridium sordellii]CEO12483.1 RNA-binding cell division protein [[Clostridium] sordellii] [Paeniclostridium sordellii]CEP81631.1 RNA-binding cell division protein [[Clostridium] sordellii] [Paeniclostridium sordellii]CEP87869.1 RNA-binding cell division protein [[Clostridium] sordellii] [Paeniclostr
MDKITLTNHIKDIDLKNKMYKVIDKAYSSIKNYDVRYTDFLNPYEIKNAISILNSFDDIKYTVDGGIDESERSLICIYPYYMEYDDIESPVKALQIEGNFKFKEIKHKDYLGALLNLGIKREKIGDINIYDNFCQVIVNKDIYDFITINLNKVSRNNVEVKEIQLSEIIKSQPKFKEISGTISSERLDCVISSIYNISRQESLKLINAEKVFVNYEKIDSPSKMIKKDSLISVRGKGRTIIYDIGDLTKKGKIKVKAKIIL